MDILDIWKAAGDVHAAELREMQREHPTAVLRFEVTWSPQSGHFEIRPQIWGHPMHYRIRDDPAHPE